MNSQTDEIIVEQMLKLNELELFLRAFQEKYFVYQERVIGDGGEKRGEYDKLLLRMKREWEQVFENQDFFLEETPYYIEESYFIPPWKNVGIVKNLRYMPLMLHTHQFIEVSYVLKNGSSYYIDEQNRFGLQEGDVILSPPDFCHTFQANHVDSIIIDIMIRITTFDTAFFNLLSNQGHLAAMFTNVLYGSPGGYVLFRTQGNKGLREQVLSMYQEWAAADSYSDRMLEVMVMEFFITLMRHYEHAAIFPASYENRVDEQFSLLNNYMHTHYQTVTLTNMAMACGYSERQIIRLLKKNTGKSFSGLLLNIKMKKAASFLKESDMTVSEIAKQLGYSGVGYFNRVFIKVYGVTPEEFRENEV